MGEGKKIEIEIPEGYEFVQDGMKFEFVKKDEPITGWWDKDTTVTGHYVDGVSDVCVADSHPRNRGNRNIFATESQAEGMIAMAMLSQQLADVNQGWEPDWGEYSSKWCIHSDFEEGRVIFVAAGFWYYHHFLSFKTQEDAEKFLDENIKEIKLAKDFI